MSLRRLLPFLMLLVISLTLMTYQSNKGIIIAPLRFIRNPFNHLNSLFHSLSSSIKEPFRKSMLRDEENRRLRAEIDRLMSEQQRYRDIFFENQRLRELLSLRENEKKYVAAARVISRGLDRWSNTIVIDKGKINGISKDMAVVTPRGLVGKVSLVTDNYAYVLLVTDINFSAAIRIQETRKEAILSGNEKNCILKYITQEDAVKEGEVVSTSGLDDLFPKDVVVGYISKVFRKGDSIFQNIEVRPFQDMTSLDEVAVIRR